MVSRSVLAGAMLAGGATAVVMDLPIIISNSYAVVNVDIGTPVETYRLLFDTGSASSWVYDEYCAEECANASGYERVGYNVTASKSGRLMGPDAYIEYMPNTIYGKSATDIFKMGPAEWNQSFIAASDSNWGALAADGFLGLAFASIAEGNTSTVMETMMKTEMLNKPRFGLYYGTEFVGGGKTEQTDGILTLGSSREEKYVEGDIKWTDLQNYGEYQLWRTDISAVSSSRKDSSSGEETTKNVALNNAWAVFDTGAAGISLPKANTIALYESMGWSWNDLIKGKHIPLCSEFNETWSVTFHVGRDTELTVRGDQLKRPGFAYRDDACWPPFDTNESTGLVLIGKLFLRNFYSVFDFGAFEVNSYVPKIGFGKLKEEYQMQV